MIIYRLGLIGVICLLLTPGTGLAAAPQSGMIAGSLSYPSEYIPDDMTISAEDLATQKVYSTSKHLMAKKYQYKADYKLAVPPRRLPRLCRAPRSGPAWRRLCQGLPGLLLGIVKWGMNVNCKSPAPITVKVKSGETIRGIDPQDWYK